MSDKAGAMVAVGQDQTVAAPLAKIASAWAVVGITSWADFASALAALYTLCLLGEWVWKKLSRKGAKNVGES